MFVNIDNLDAGEVLEDPSWFKLFLAGLFIQKIPNTVPENHSSAEYLSFEVNCESFLFFLCSGQDVLFREIYEQILDVFFYYPPLQVLKTKLTEKSSSNVQAATLSSLIQQYFPEPQLRAKKITSQQRRSLVEGTFSDEYMLLKIENGNVIHDTMDSLPDIEFDESQSDGDYQLYWDITNSELSITRQMRNDVTHNWLQGSMRYANQSNTLRFTTKKRPKRTSQQIKDAPLEFTYLDFEIQDPHRFFMHIFTSTQIFKSELRKILPFKI
ncbi:MAG: hypothetical protein IIA82_08175 [Thaumarchaeota archaeon]|nr:hypothetical protein [Nitrososphaerota archaeon]